MHARTRVSAGADGSRAKLVHTLLENIIRHPSEIKYRSFKAAQPKIARDVLTLDAGKSLLIDIGFRTRAVAFQQEWFVPVEWTEKSLGFKRIEWSREVVGTKLHEFEENAERVRSNKEREKSFEQSRKVRAPRGSAGFTQAKAHACHFQSRALEEAREDRERVALRAQREKAARSAAEAKAAADKEAEVTSEARSHVDNAADAGWDASADD